MALKKVLNLLIISFLFGQVLFPAKSIACSVFMLRGDDYCFIGFNENWKTMPGMVVLNKAGVSKQNLSWNYLTSDTVVKEPKLGWISRYGSVSFNLLGIDLPCYGMNEKGLYVVELFLDNTYSINDSSKAKMFWGQWIQYQLDNYATVEEVIQNLNSSPVIDWWPTFPGSHFFVSDKMGNTAAIELIDGIFQVSCKETMPVPVLCNRPYQQELDSLKDLELYGGSKPFNNYSTKWNDRFAKAAVSIKNYNRSKQSPLDFSWQLLDSISPGQWQMVADVKNGILYFRSDVSRKIKYVELSKCDFSKNTPQLFIDINSNLKGNVTKSFGRLTAAINQQYVEKGFPIGYENKEFYSSRYYLNLKRNLGTYIRRVYHL